MKKIIPVIVILISLCFLSLTYLNKPFQKSEILITSHNNQHVQQYAKENNYKYQNISDSEYNNIQKENEEDFTYNITNNQIEITGYKNIQSKIIIPENIENHPVTTISMNLNYTPKEIYLPSGVTLINTLINENINNNFYFTLIIEIFATILILIITFILNKKKNQDKIVYIAFLYILSFIYLLAMNICAYLNINNLLHLSIIITIIYFILFLPIYFAKKRLNEYDKNIQNTNNFIENALKLAQKTNNEKLIETIKYSDPITNENTKNIETQIINTLKENKKENVENIINMIKERNEICKKTKGN